MDYYNGEHDLSTERDMPTATPKAGSAAVSTDVADTIEGLMPSLMEIFAAGEEVVGSSRSARRTKTPPCRRRITSITSSCRRTPAF
jgi:hypothetical protein